MKTQVEHFSGCAVHNMPAYSAGPCDCGASDTTLAVDSASDARTVNNTVRHQYRVLSDAEKAQMVAIKDKGLEFLTLMGTLGKSRESSLAITKIEEAVMWAVKGITT